MTRRELLEKYAAGERTFIDAGLCCSDLHDVNLRGATMRHADLHGADLRHANMRDVNLRGANLTKANLDGSDLRGADIDFASWPLWCGSLNVIVDRRIFLQMLEHALALDVRNEDDTPDKIAATIRRALINLLDEYHHPEIIEVIRRRMAR